jgi:FMN-dependent NADH-azoreductase
MNILHIDSSILGANSVSRALTAAITEKQMALHPGATVTYRDLAAAPTHHLSPAHIGAMFGHPPTDAATLADIETGTAMLEEVFAADIIVIGAPMYNFTIPTQLKAWVDRLLIAGKTFKYNEQGAPVGLLPATKKVFIASSRGGQYADGAPFAPFDHQETYLKAALNFIGLTDLSVIRAEGVAVPALKEPAIAKAHAEIAALSA